MTADPILTEYEIALLRNVENHGCQVTHVFDPAGEDESFSYSAGLPVSVGQPDVIVFGLPKDLMHSMINEVASQYRKGLILSDGQIIEGLIEGYPCVARQVLGENIVADYFNSAMWVHQRELGRPMEAAFQIVWPGVEQRLFPWDEGCDEALIAAQLPLYSQRMKS